MFWHSCVRRAGVVLSSDSSQEDDILFNRVKTRYKPKAFFLKAVTGTRLQGWAAAAGILVGAAFFLGPWLWDEWKELLHWSFVPVDPSQMPRTSPEWWENEWRKMNVGWRVGESTDDFYVRPYAFVKEQTGRDMTTAEAFVASRPRGAAAQHDGDGILSRVRWLFSRQPRNAAAGASDTQAHRSAGSDVVRALVPLCGDSPILRTMAIQGYDVDGVECSQTAIQSAVEKTERALPLDAYSRVHLLWNDFFAPDLWEGPLKGKKYDIIYERQGMTSLNREQRPDYAFLLQRALKDDGVLYVEGIFRTGRVKGNKQRGPPYSLSRKELESLFPRSDGYFVRCEEKTDAMMQLSRENRILQRVPRQLFVTPFSCVVFRAASVNMEARQSQGDAHAASPPAATA